MITKNISTLKIHKLTQAQYDRELAAGRIDENAIYLTPEEEVDLSIYATKDYVNSLPTENTTYTISKNGKTVVLTGSDGSTSEYIEENVYYVTITPTEIDDNGKPVAGTADKSSFDIEDAYNEGKVIVCKISMGGPDIYLPHLGNIFSLNDHAVMFGATAFDEGIIVTIMGSIVEIETIDFVSYDDIPTDVSQLNNDSGYITSDDVEEKLTENYYTKDYMDAAYAEVQEGFEQLGNAYSAIAITGDLAVQKAHKDNAGNIIIRTYETKDDATAKLAEAKSYTDTAVSGKADKEHTHDDRYYTESEVDGKFNTLVGNTPVSTQIGNAIANKADKAITLAGYGITDAAAKNHTHKADEFEINTPLGELQGDTVEEVLMLADEAITAIKSGKVDKVSGKGLSTNDLTNTLKSNYDAAYAHVSRTDNPHSVTKSQVDLGNVTNDAQVKRTEMGVASGVATLDKTGKVPTSQLPSYVDDVLEYDRQSSFPTEGETGKIYIAKDTNKTYRWSGSGYVEISASLALGETSSTAYAGDKGKANADAIAVLNSRVGNDTVTNQINTAIATKADTSALTSHTGDTTAHITAAERTKWNAAKTHADSTHAPSNAEANQNAFSNVKVGTSTIAADSATDTLTLTAGDNITLTANTSNDSVTITATDTTYSQATDSTLGLVKIGYTQSNKNYPVKLNDSGQMFVNVPWSDNNTWKANSNSSEGYVASGSGQANKVWKTDADGAPAWRDDANTTYTAGTGLDLTNNQFSLNTAGSALGGVKTTSDVTSTSGLTATPIINGVPYYKDTNTHYASSTIVGADATATSNATVVASTNKIYLNHIENSAVKSSHNIIGAGPTKVSYDSSKKEIKIDSSHSHTITTGSDTTGANSGDAVSVVNTAALKVTDNGVLMLDLTSGSAAPNGHTHSYVKATGTSSV